MEQFLIAVIVGMFLGAVAHWAYSTMWRRYHTQQEKLADFFEPIRYPDPDSLDRRRAAKEYSQHTTAAYDGPLCDMSRVTDTIDGV